MSRRTVIHYGSNQRCLLSGRSVLLSKHSFRFDKTHSDLGVCFFILEPVSWERQSLARLLLVYQYKWR